MTFQREVIGRVDDDWGTNVQVSVTSAGDVRVNVPEEVAILDVEQAKELRRVLKRAIRKIDGKEKIVHSR